MQRSRGPITVGVLGGSFDPPHLGHVLMPTYLRARGLVDAVIVAPVVDHPFGKVTAPFEQRLAWTRAAMSVHGGWVEVSEIERELAERHGGPSVTLRLLEAIACARPGDRVRLVVGSDIVQRGETARWVQWDRIVEAFDPIVVPRAGYAPASVCALPEISSSVVRAWIAEARWEALREVVPAAVVESLQRPRQGVVAIVGHGNVGTHAEPWLRGLGWEVTRVGGRASTTEAELVLEPRPDAVWIAVPDPYVREVAQALVGRLPAGVPVLHAAGARRACEVLAPLAEQGHPVGTLHPICSLRHEVIAGSPLGEAMFGIEGDAAARDVARRWVPAERRLDLGALDARGRVAYHAACALVANHLAVLLESAGRVLGERGLDRAAVDDALMGLLASAVANLAVLGSPAGITGPVARGDRATVAAHLEALDDDTAALYGELSRRLEALVGLR